MTNEQMYGLSKEANETIRKAKALLSLYVIQYRHLVDNSDRGFDCPYAVAAARYFLSERDHELSTLKDLRDAVDSLIQHIEDCDNGDEAKDRV